MKKFNFNFKSLLVLVVVLLFGARAWAETATATSAGTYSFGSTNIGAVNKFGELSTNSVFIYRNSSYSTGQNGIKCVSGNNSGFVFYLTSPMTLKATVYQNSSTSETVTLYVKTVTSDFFQALVDGEVNKTVVSAPTLTASGTASQAGPSSKTTFDITYGSTLAAGYYYYVYCTSSASSVATYHRSITLTSGSSGYTLTASPTVINPMTEGSKTGAIMTTITNSPVTGITSGTTTSTSSNTFTVAKATPVTVTAPMTVAGTSAQCDECTYRFDSWENIPASVTADVSNIHAKYNTTYTISFKETDESAVDGISSTYYVYGTGKAVSSYPTPTKSGYNFNGWYKENTLTNAATDIGTTAYGNVTVYAKWSVACSATANAGADKSTTYNTGVAMAATAASSGFTGAWSISSGPSTSTSQLSSTSAYNATFTPSAAGNYTLVWTVTDDSDGSCSASDEATVTVSKANISPSLSYESSTLIVGDNSSSPTVSGNSGSGSVSYAVTSASPAGCITVDSGTGVVTAVAAGTGTVTATVAGTTNYNGNTCTADFTVNNPPVADHVSISGEWAAFIGYPISITATPYDDEDNTIDQTGMSYQWYKDGTADGNMIDGETSATLNIASATTEDYGSYYCKISKDGCTDVFSSAFGIKIMRIHLMWQNGTEVSDYAFHNFVPIGNSKAVCTIALEGYNYSLQVLDGQYGWGDNNEAWFGRSNYWGTTANPWTHGTVDNKTYLNCDIAGDYVFTLDYSSGYKMGVMYPQPTYYYKGNDDGWSSTHEMTKSCDGTYAYFWTKGATSLQAAGRGTNNNNFLITNAAGNSTIADGNKLEIRNDEATGFGGTDIWGSSNMGKWDGSSSNASIYNAGDFYIVVYYPNNSINTTNDPKICASTKLPGNATTADEVVYFEKPASNWGDKAYYRIGHRGTSSAPEMELVPGTARLYQHVLSEWTGYEAWSIANNSSWQGSNNSIYQVNTGDTYAVTKSTNYFKCETDGNITIILDDANNTADGCTYYNVNTYSGMLTHTATVGSTTNGSIQLDWTDTDGDEQTATSTTSGLAHTCNLTVTGVPATGYDVATLTVDGDDFTSGETHVLTDDATIAATFALHNYNVTYSAPSNGSYTISVAGGSATSATKTATYGQTITLAASANTGYSFTSWTVTKDGGGTVTVTSNQFTMPADNVTITAIFTVNSYDLTWNLGGGTTTSAGTGIASGVSANTTSSVAYGTGLTAPTVTKTGYDFTAWDPSVESTMPAAVTTYTATWTAKTTTITIDDNDDNHGSTTPGDVTATYGSALPSFTAAGGESGWKLRGYYTAETGGTKIINADGTLVASTSYADGSSKWNSEVAELTLYPQYDPVYTVSFNTNGAGGSVSPIEQSTYGGSITMPSAPSYTNYTFQGWVIGGNAYDPTDSYTPTANVTAYASWKATCAGGGGDPVVLKLFDGSTDEAFASSPISSGGVSVSYTSPDAPTTLDISKRTNNVGNDKNYSIGFQYGQSYTDNQSVNRRYLSFTIPSGYTATFTYAFAASGNNRVIRLGSSFVLDDEASGYIATLVTFPTSGGSGVIEGGTYSSSLSAGTYYITGTVGGWSVAELIFTLTPTSGGGTCYYVTYDGNGAEAGLTSDPTAYNSSSNTVTVKANGAGGAAYTKSGHTFIGWNTKSDGSGVSKSAGGTFTITKDTVLYAQWSNGSGYSITYDCDGATSGCPNDVAAATNLPNPLPSAQTKTGYTFDGWYTNSGKTDAAVAGATLTGNTTLYAKWLPKAVYDPDMSTSDDLTTMLAAKFGGNNRWTLTTGENLVGKPSDVGKPASDNLAEGNLAYKASSSANATYDLGAETTIYQLTLKLLLGDTEGSVYIGYDDDSWEEVAHEDAEWDGEESAWIEKTFDFNYPTGVRGVRYIHVYGNNTYQMGMSQFKVEYAPTKTEIVLDDQSATTAGTESVTATYGASTNLTSDITAPTKTGYTFGGYYTEENGEGTQLIDENGAWLASKTDYTDGSKNWQFANPDLTLYAKWTVNTYDVDLTLTGSKATKESGTTGTNAATYGTNHTLTFAAVSGYTLPSDVTVYIGEDQASKGTEYSWSVSAGVGTLTIDGNYILDDITITVTATAAVTTYSVTYAADVTLTDGDEPEDDTEYNGGESVTVKGNTGSMVYTGYTFRGWKYNGTFYLPGQSFTMPAANVTLTAVWEPNSLGTKTLFSTDFSDDDWDGITNICNSGNSDDETHNGITFHSYYKNATPFVVNNSAGTLTWCNNNMKDEFWIAIPITGVNGSITISVDNSSSETRFNYAIKQETSISGSPGTGTSSTAGDPSVVTIPDLDKSNYVVYLGRQGSGKTTLTSISITTPGADGHFDVAFDNQTGFGGTSSLPSTIYGVENGLKILQPSTPTATGYTFGGWYTDDGCASSWTWGSSTVTSDMTLYAKWTANETTVTINANTGNHGSTAPSAFTATYGQALPEFTAATGVSGWRLTGYYDAATSGTKVIDADGTFSSNSGIWNRTDGDALTLYAQYEEALYTITYNANGGSCATSTATQTSAGEELTLPKPTWSGYSFDGWYNAGSEIGGAGDKYEPTDDINLYAKWTDNIDGKVFSFIDHNYGDKFKAFDESGWVSSNQNKKGTTYTNATTGVQFIIDDGTWENKTNAIAALAKFNGSGSNVSSMSIVIPAGYIATVKILYGAYGKGDDYCLTVGGTKQANPDGKLDNGSTNAQVIAAMKEITLENQTGTLTLGIYNTEKNHYIGRVAATITSYQDLTYVGGSGSNWNTTANWSPECVPTIEHDVVIESPVLVNIEHATAKSIVIYNNGSDKTGKLTIQPNKGLEVDGTIQKTTDGSTKTATGEADLVLESNEDGNASLIFNNSNSCQATVQMYSKATIVGNTWNWQYVGTPFTGSIPLYNYYGSWMYKWDNGGWDVVKGGDELDPFAGYCLTQSEATTHVMGGTLVPTTSKSVTMAASTDMVLANSWTAPISIASFDIEGGDATFTSTPATIYLFNTGMGVDDGNGNYTATGEGTEAGTYITVPINSAPYTGNGLIAPMQGFFVTTNGGAEGTITMNYNDLVRPSGEHTDIVAGPMKAPKRIEERPEVMKIRAEGSVYNDRVVILSREDFSQGFDNGWDGKKMSFGNASPSVYVINEEGGYDAVSAIPEYEGTVVGFRAGTDSEYTIRFEYDGEEMLYLNDLQEQEATPIDSMRTYTFTAEAGDNEARFIISATPVQKVTTGVDPASGGQDAKVRKVIINDHIYIIRGGRMYSVDGALVK